MGHAAGSGATEVTDFAVTMAAGCAINTLDYAAQSTTRALGRVRAPRARLHPVLLHRPPDFSAAWRPRRSDPLNPRGQAGQMGGTPDLLTLVHLRTRLGLEWSGQRPTRCPGGQLM